MKIESFLFSGLGTTERIAIVLAIAAAAHLCVRLIRRLTVRLSSTAAVKRWAKLRTLTSLLTSITVFSLYFGALGLVLQEFGVSLTAYLASASIIGLAIGFGSQGLVQDVVTGLTVIFSDLFEVDDLVEISTQTGTVLSIGMRFYRAAKFAGCAGIHTQPDIVQRHRLSARLCPLLCRYHAVSAGRHSAADAG